MRGLASPQICSGQNEAAALERIVLRGIGRIERHYIYRFDSSAAGGLIFVPAGNYRYFHSAAAIRVDLDKPMTRVQAFLLGITVMMSTTAGVFFLKFWRSTRDVLFLAFAAFFLLEAVDRTTLFIFARDNEGSPWVYFVRLLATLGILAAILKKNYGGGRPRAL
jgi:hypothetical protein